MNRLIQLLLGILLMIFISVFFIIDKKDIQYLGCMWEEEGGIQGLCSFKKIQHLGCTWKIPAYMNKRSSNSYYSSSKFGFHNIHFHNKKMLGDISSWDEYLKNKIQLKGFSYREYNDKSIQDKIQKMGFERIIYIHTDKDFGLGYKNTEITRKGYPGKVDFHMVDAHAYFYGCLNSAK